MSNELADKAYKWCKGGTTILEELPMGVWAEKKAADPETATHPCDNHPSKSCMCKGSCGCHFVEHKNAEPYAPQVASLLKLLTEVRDEERERCARLVEERGVGYDTNALAAGIREQAK